MLLLLAMMTTQSKLTKHPKLIFMVKFLAPEKAKKWRFLAPEIATKWRFLAPEISIMGLFQSGPRKSQNGALSGARKRQKVAISGARNLQNLRKHFLFIQQISSSNIIVFITLLSLSAQCKLDNVRKPVNSRLEIETKYKSCDLEQV